MCRVGVQSFIYHKVHITYYHFQGEIRILVVFNNRGKNSQLSAISNKP